MKKLDRLLITSYIPPFFVTFMIAMFVLLMQTLWLYIDDIAGKGLGFFLLMELLAYRSVSLIPMALPLGILISSVMVLGNLAENYELSSFKSAGVPLLRIMRPLIIFSIISMVFSYFCSNNLIPVANLKFGSRMYDIQRQKPAFRLDAGVFNEDFQGYAIHIGRKKQDGRSIENVLIYDHSNANRDHLSSVSAKTGEFFGTPDGKYFIMELHDGHQYVEVEPSANSNRSFPFVRTSFKNWTKVFDLSEFELSRTNEELFKQNRTMMSSAQLREAIDSMNQRIQLREKSFYDNIKGYYHYIPVDSSVQILKTDPETPTENAYKQDTVRLIEASRLEAKPIPHTKIDTTKTTPQKDSIRKMMTKPLKPLRSTKLAVNPSPTTIVPPPNPPRPALRVFKQSTDSLLVQNGFYKSFVLNERKEISSKAKTLARGVMNQSESAARALDTIRETEAKHIFELWTKSSMAVVCFIFIFIGAPMGAIVRKGGFGYPILVSIIFFMLFVIITIFCRKIAETLVIPAMLAAWLPCIILFPIGLFLTYKAMNDVKIVNIDSIRAYWKEAQKWIRKRLNKE